jgi:hypothetical protein
MLRLAMTAGLSISSGKTFLLRARIHIAFAAAIAGCSSDHTLLAEKPPPSDAAVTIDVSTPPDAPPDVSSPRPDVTPVDAAPPLPWALTWVNGLVDVPAAQFCFVPLVDGSEAPLAAPAFPQSGSLAFGAHFVLSSLAGVDPATTSVHPYAIVGGAPGASCATLLSAARGAESGPAPSVTSLPLIPAGTLTAPASYLAIASGCLADPAMLPDAGRDPVCGALLGGSGPDLVLVQLSRETSPLKIGFQAVHASRASPGAQVDLLDTGLTATLTSFGPFAYGQITPTIDPNWETLVAVGRDSSQFGIRVTASAGQFSTSTTSLTSILSTSGLDTSRNWASGNLTFVLLGASPRLDAGAVPQSFQVVAVPNAPDLTHD